jgi:hypothetical protein
MSLTISSAVAVIHSVPLTKFAVTGFFQVCPGILKINFSTQQSTLMEMVVAWQRWEVGLGTG